MSRLATPWQAQHRNAAYLLLNNVTGAAAGLLFWILLARVAGLEASEIGVGYAIVALGTLVGVLAKGGFDTALLRHVPGASHAEGARLLGMAAVLGAALALGLAATVAVAAGLGLAIPGMPAGGWLLAGAIGAALAVSWLQDAYFLAEGDARFSFQRNLVLAAARLLLPVPLVLLATPQPVAVAWGLAIVASVLAAAVFARRRAPRAGRVVPRREFLASAARNMTGSAAEFLPGLLLAPIVLATAGAAAAAHFGMAWTAATLLFLASAAISRSALAELVRQPSQPGPAIQRAVMQHLWLVLPAAILAMVMAPVGLAIFGPDYATAATPALVLLAASILFVAPTNLYLSYLRAIERPYTLVLFPAAMVLTILVLAPLLGDRAGLTGVALAWLLANAPFGLWACWRLWSITGVKLAAPVVHGGPHAE